MFRGVGEKMSEEQENTSYPEVIIGLVAPLGSDIPPFIKSLKECIKTHDYDWEDIKVTDLLIEKFNGQTKSMVEGVPSSLKTYFKMEACTAYRKKSGGGVLAALAVKEISRIRKKGGSKKIIYIVDQLKNLKEYELLNNIYGENYIQISCFSNKSKRNANLEGKFKKPESKNNNIENDLEKWIQEKIWNEYKDFFDYQSLAVRDASSSLIDKDFEESISTNKDGYYKEFGQQIATLFDKSHFFINLDRLAPSIEEQTKKFVDLLFGGYEQYPTQEEFGMSVAYAASKRSTFPGDRHIGACIICENGELIAAGSIRAPSSSADPRKEDENSVKDAYDKQKKKRDDLEKLIEEKYEDKEKQKTLLKFVHDSMEFHPCTHAEMSAIADAAKIGISTKGSTLYTTTFPCHMCAKDIVTSGIRRVVFIEAFPKSKNEELYSNIIEIDPDDEPDQKIPFYTFYGVGPRRYNYVYSLENTSKNRDFEESDLTSGKGKVPRILRFRLPIFYQTIEEKICSYFEQGLNTEELKIMFGDLLFLDSVDKK